MSSSEDDVYAWDAGDDDEDECKDGGITGGFAGASRNGKGATRASSRGKRGKKPNYNDPSSSSEDDDRVTRDDGEEENASNEVQSVSPMTRRASPRKSKALKESLDFEKKEKPDRTASCRNALDNNHTVGQTLPAAKDSIAAFASNGERSNQNNAGINVLIPHSLLNKHQGAGRNECTMLVQVDATGDRHLDFHGQSGAVGRFEADEEGVTLDLKGFQYRGTIRPGPTAMVIALTRDGQFKVEAITDEFVTLDTDRTNMMDKLNAVVEGEMDDGYKVIDDNVNRSEKKKAAKDDEGNENNDAVEKKGTKRQSDRRSNGGAPKKRKISLSKKK